MLNRVLLLPMLMHPGLKDTEYNIFKQPFGRHPQYLVNDKLLFFVTLCMTYAHMHASPTPLTQLQHTCTLLMLSLSNSVNLHLSAD